MNANRRSLLNGLALLLLLAAVAPFVVYAVPEAVGADQSYVVLTGSMEPAISPGDAVVVADTDPDSIRRDDVVTFSTGSETPTTHRVVDVTEQNGELRFETKGDANEDPDQSLVRPDQLRGKVVLVLPYIGLVVNFVNTPVGFVALVIVPLALLAVSELSNLVSTIRDRSEENDDSDAKTPGESSIGASDSDAVSAGSTPDGDGEPSTGSDITLSRAELRVALALLALVTPYAGWVAYETREAWSITGSVAATLLFGFVAVAYQAVPDSDDDDRPTESTHSPSADAPTAPSSPMDRSTTGPVVSGFVPDDDGREPVVLDSLESLVRLAVADESPIVAAEDGYYVVRKHAAYRVAASDRSSMAAVSNSESDSTTDEGRGGEGA